MADEQPGVSPDVGFPSQRGGIAYEEAAMETRRKFFRHRTPPAVGLGVSQAWFYEWLHGDPSVRDARREQVRIEIARLFAAHKGRYRSPRITADLREEGWSVSVSTSQ